MADSALIFIGEIGLGNFRPGLCAELRAVTVIISNRRYCTVVSMHCTQGEATDEDVCTAFFAVRSALQQHKERKRERERERDRQIDILYLPNGKITILNKIHYNKINKSEYRKNKYKNIVFGEGLSTAQSEKENKKRKFYYKLGLVRATCRSKIHYIQIKYNKQIYKIYHSHFQLSQI